MTNEESILKKATEAFNSIGDGSCVSTHEIFVFVNAIAWVAVGTTGDRELIKEMFHSIADSVNSIPQPIGQGVSKITRQ